MTDKKQLRLGESLIAKGFINKAQLENALNIQKFTREFLGAILIQRGLIKEKDLLNVLSEQMNIPFIELDIKEIDWNVARQIPDSIFAEHKCFPVSQDDFSVTLAVSNPLDAWGISKIEKRIGDRKIKLVIVTRRDILNAIEIFDRKKREGMRKLFEEN